MVLSLAIQFSNHGSHSSSVIVELGHNQEKFPNPIQIPCREYKGSKKSYVVLACSSLLCHFFRTTTSDRMEKTRS